MLGTMTRMGTEQNFTEQERTDVEAEAERTIGAFDQDELNVHAYEFPAWH